MTPLAPFTRPSLPSTVAFLLVVLCVSGALSVALARAARARGVRPWAAPAALACWMALAAALSASGLLERDSMPPPLMFFFLGSNLAAVALALSPLGEAVAAATPAFLLVGFQAFRLPLELVLHRWWVEGVIPVQMTFSGYNFDILTGIASLLGAIALRRRWVSEAAVLPLNVLGSALLGAVAVIAVTSSPGPLRRFTEGQALLLAYHAPYSWIVTICVAGALFGHIVTFRWWRARRPAAAG